MMYQESLPQKDPAQKVTLLGMLLNLVLIFAKLWGGIAGHSTALVADAIHSVSDLFSDLLVLWGLKIGEKGPDTNHHFGHGKIETMATMGMGIIVIATGIGIGVEAASKIRSEAQFQPGVIVLVIALISLITKEALYHYTKITGERLQRPVLISNAWHHRSDALSSLTVLVGAIGARIDPSWSFLDSYAAILVSLLIIKSGVSIFIEATKDIVDTAPDPALCREFENIARKTPGVIEVHDIKIRRSGRFLLVYIEIGVKPDLPVRDASRLAGELEENIRRLVHGPIEVSVNVRPARSFEFAC